MTESSYSVGKGKPPTNTQFKKGQSGNPGGKPKSKAAAPATSMQQRLKEAMEDAFQSDWSTVKFERDEWDHVDDPMRRLAREIVVYGVEGSRESRTTLLALMEKLDKLKMNDKVSKTHPVSLTEGKAEGKAEGKTAEAVASAEKTDANQ